MYHLALEHYGLNKRVIKALSTAGIRSIYELYNADPSYLMNIKGIGQASMDKIVKAITIAPDGVKVMSQLQGLTKLVGQLSIRLYNLERQLYGEDDEDLSGVVSNRNSK